TAEVLACKQYARTLVTRVIQNKIGIQGTFAVIHSGLTMVEIAPLIESIRPKTGTLDRLQKLLGNNGIGIHISPIQWYNYAFHFYKRLHTSLYLVDFCTASPAFSRSFPIPSTVLQPISTNAEISKKIAINLLIKLRLIRFSSTVLRQQNVQL